MDYRCNRLGRLFLLESERVVFSKRVERNFGAPSGGAATPVAVAILSIDGATGASRRRRKVSVDGVDSPTAPPLQYSAP